MKKLIVLMALTASTVLITQFSYGQCNCQRLLQDGQVIMQCPPNMVASDNTTAIGFAAGTTGGKTYVTLTVRFKSSAKELNGKLSIRLSDGNIITMEMFNGGLAFIGNSEVAQGIYQLDGMQLKKLIRSNIKTVTLTLTDSLKRTYAATSNANILVKHLNCLNS